MSITLSCREFLELSAGTSAMASMAPGMTPASKTRFEFLLGVKEHEMHHRGQLMLIERMVGIVPHLTREMTARMATMRAAKAAS